MTTLIGGENGRLVEIDLDAFRREARSIKERDSQRDRQQLLYASRVASRLALADGLRIKFGDGRGSPPMTRKEMYSRQTLQPEAIRDAEQRRRMMAGR